MREDYNLNLFDPLASWGFDYKKFVYETNDDYSVNKPGFVFWDLKLSNKCNFKCRMCSWTSSSSFELEQFGKISGKWNASEKTYEEVEPFLGVVKHIYFSGGESIIIDEHWKIMDKLIELGRNIRLLWPIIVTLVILCIKVDIFLIYGINLIERCKFILVWMV